MRLFAVLHGFYGNVVSIHSSQRAAEAAIAHWKSVVGEGHEEEYMKIEEFILNQDPIAKDNWFSVYLYPDGKVSASYNDYVTDRQYGNMYTMDNGIVHISIMAPTMAEAIDAGKIAYAEAVAKGAIPSVEQWKEMMNLRRQQEVERQHTSAAISAAIATAPSK
jgi:hypothetical protein